MAVTAQTANWFARLVGGYAGTGPSAREEEAAADRSEERRFARLRPGLR